MNTMTVKLHPTATTDLIVIGIDPGPIAGIVGLRYSNNERKPTAAPVVAQVSCNAILAVLRALIPPESLVVLAYELFVVGPRSARSAHAAAGAVTRGVCGQLDTLASNHVRVVHRPMASISEWASDERLSKAGLWELTKGMAHARSAGRHAIFAAKEDIGIPDPLSRKHRPARAATAPHAPAVSPFGASA